MIAHLTRQPGQICPHHGSAAWFQEHTDCRIYASEGERPWIEDIDLQFKERPIPNFYALAGKSSRVDVVVREGDIIQLEDGLPLEVIRTASHSREGLSYRLGESMFIGDAIPVKGDSMIEKQHAFQRLRNPVHTGSLSLCFLWGGSSPPIAL